MMNDKLIIRKYQRISPLVIQPPLKSIQNAQPGDCFISFSRKQCHALKMVSSFNIHYKEIKRMTLAGIGSKLKIQLDSRNFNKVAIVYGNLPPEARRVQAARFNDTESDVQYLVATDAVGMGLNFNIKRLIFYEMTKNDGQRIRNLTSHEIRQIAGRAGRYKQQGFVTTFNAIDYSLLKQAITDNETLYTGQNVSEVVELCSDEEDNPEIKFSEQEQEIKRAGIFPSFSLIQQFSLDLEKCEGKAVTLSQIFRKFENLAKLDGKYFFQRIQDICKIAEAIEDVPLNLQQKYIFCHAPVRINIQSTLQALRKFALDFVIYEEVSIPKNIKHEIKNGTRSITKLDDLEEGYYILEVYE